MRREEILARVSERPSAAAVVECVERELLAFLEAQDGAPSPQTVRRLAVDVICCVLRPERPGESDGPPWEPPRYGMPSERTGATKRLLIHDEATGNDVKMYVTLNHYPDGRPAEMFVTKQSDTSTIGALLDALAVSVSIGLQHGIPWRLYFEKFAFTSFPPWGWTEERLEDLARVRSILAYVFRWAQHKIDEARSAFARQQTDAVDAGSDTSPSCDAGESIY